MPGAEVMMPRQARARRILVCSMIVLILAVIAIGALESSRQHRRAAALVKLREVGPVMTMRESQQWNDYVRSLTGNSKAYPRRTSFQRLWDRFRPNDVLNISMSNEVTEETIELIKLFPEVGCLQLDGSSISDEQLGELNSLTNLRHLYLDGTPVTDVGIASVANFRQLRWLELSGTNITDASVEQLLKLQHLKVLRLRETSISEAGAAKLAALRNLQFLEIVPPRDQPERITENLKDTFQRVNPKCRVLGFERDYEVLRRELIPWYVRL